MRRPALCARLASKMNEHGAVTTRRADAELLRALHRDVDRVRDLPVLLAGIAHLVAVALCIIAYHAHLWLLVIALWIALAWSSHAALTRLHEAVHRMLSRSRRRNELHGVVIGTLAWTPMSVYRHVHARHHAHLGGPADPEFRPYSMTASPRWLRRTYAWAELLAGFVVTPALYTWRTAAVWHSHRPALRRRLSAEALLTIAVWTTILAIVAANDWWAELAVGHLVPAWLTGVMQTVRKFTEHLGMHGDSIPSMTRSVAYRGRLGRLLSRSQLHVDHHGTHHAWPRLPWFDLPRATPIAYAGLPPPYRSHLAAVHDALRHLSDPTVGPQWDRST